MRHIITKLTSDLITIPTTKENPDSLKQILSFVRKDLTSFPCKEFTENSYPSLLIYNEKTKNRKFKVILNAHLDVVPANLEQFKPFEKGGKLIGRGSYDMKGGAAAQILAFKEVANKVSYPLALQLVTDEEIGGFNGTKYQIEQGVRGEFVLAGEPTDLAVNNQSKGVIWLTIEFRGDSVHGAYLWKGKNALWEMQSFLKKLETLYPKPDKEVWTTTVNLSYVKTDNSTFNKSANNAVLALDIRYMGETAQQVLQKIKKILPKSSKISVFFEELEQNTSPESQFIKTLVESTHKVIGKKAAIIKKHGGSDVRFYDEYGSDTVTFGPIGSGLHQNYEWVDTKSLEDFYHVLVHFLKSL